MMIRLPEKHVVVIVLLLLTMFFLVTPFVARSLQGNDALLGEESYFHLGLAQNIAGQADYPFHESQPTLFDWLISLLVVFVHPLLVGKLVPVVLGLVSVVLFMHILSQEFVNRYERVSSSLLFIISPVFIILFTTLSPSSLLVTLFLASVATYRRFPVVSGLFLLSLIFINAKSFVIASLLLVAFGCSHKRWRPAAISGGVGLVVMILADALFGFMAAEQLVLRTSMHDLFVSLGAQFGYSFFILFLALVGVIGSWSNKREFLLSSFFVVVVFIFSFSDVIARALLLPIFALLAGKGLLFLLQKKWELLSVRNATLFFIGLSLLFTLVMTVSDQVKSEPSLEKMEALLFLRSVPDNDLVLSSSENGVFLERVAKHPALLDSVRRSEQARWNDELSAQRVFYAQRLSIASSVLVEQDIGYVFIDEKMRNGGIWTYEEQGLLFLVENSNHFVKLFENREVSVYRFIRS